MQPVCANWLPTGMDKNLKKRIFLYWEKSMLRNLPEFSLFPGKSIYIFPGEKVWFSDRDGCSRFIVLSPHPKGYNETGIELAWSKKGRFPELPSRPMPVTDKNAKMEEGSIRLTELRENGTGGTFLRVSDLNYQSVLDSLMEDLLSHGIAWLDKKIA